MAFEAIRFQFVTLSRSICLALCATFAVVSFNANSAGKDDDWVWWQKVGSASLTWGFWKIYDSELRTPNGIFNQSLNEPLALVITYSRDIDAEDLLEATVDQWAHLGYTKPQTDEWLSLMTNAWPDVKEGDRLAYVLKEGKGAFYYQPLNGTPRYTASLELPALAEAFAEIWLSPATAYPDLRTALIGGK